jgi:hypothetical protein
MHPGYFFIVSSYSMYETALKILWGYYEDTMEWMGVFSRFCGGLQGVKRRINIIHIIFIDQ